MIYLITGKAGAGKTTLAKKMQERIPNAVLLDGDEIRELFPCGFTDGERLDHIMRMARFAHLLEKQGITVIIAAIMPKKEWRDDARRLFQASFLIHVPGGTLWSGTDYEEPTNDEIGLRLC